jgi:hypothetical protein
MCDGSGATSYTHNQMGWELQARRTIGTETANQINTYNLDGSVASVQSAGGYTVDYGYSGAGRPLTASNGTSFVKAATYAPPGELASMTLGSTSSFAGIVANNAYNDRLQPILLSAAVTGQSAVFSLCFNFNLGVAVNTSPCSFSATTPPSNNGNVYGCLVFPAFCHS